MRVYPTFNGYKKAGHLKHVMLLALSVLLLVVIIVFYVKSKKSRNDPFSSIPNETADSITLHSNQASDNKLLMLCKNSKILFLFKKVMSEVKIEQSNDFCEIWGEYKEEPIFIVMPNYIGQKKKLGVYFYSHGQDEFINTKNKRLYNKLTNWGKIYASNNYIFVAYNLLGNNWGNKDSQKLFNTLVKDFSQFDFVDNNNLNIIAFSMGGLLTYRYLANYEHNIKKAVILAGTVRYKEFDKEKCKKLAKTEVVIYHGDKDVNVLLSLSKNLYDRCHIYNKNLRLNILKGWDHWRLGYTQNADILLGGY